jgi:hypothetical protein
MTNLLDKIVVDRNPPLSYWAIHVLEKKNLYNHGSILKLNFEIAVLFHSTEHM